MTEKIIGPLHLVFDKTTLSVGPRGQPQWAVTLERIEIDMLINFLTSLIATDLDQRQAFRVPLWTTCGLKVKIREGARQLWVTPQNISLTGIQVEFKSDEWLDLTDNAKVQTVLEFEGISRPFATIVKRRTNLGYGLFFVESMRAEEVDPPPELTQIVMELQRRWTAQRIK